MVSGLAGVVGVHNLRSQVVVVALVPASNPAVKPQIIYTVVHQISGNQDATRLFYPPFTR